VPVPFKKACRQPNGGGRTCLGHVGAGSQRKVCLRAYLIFIDETPTGSKRHAQPLPICPRIPFSKLKTLLRSAAAKTVLALRGVAASSRVIALTKAPTIGHSLFPYDRNLL
jgi:hypothetical protein